MSEKHDHLPLRQMANKMVMDINENKIIENSQAGYMSFTNIKIQKTFRKKSEICGHCLFRSNDKVIKNLLNKYNTHVIVLLMFYEHR